jgi:hypothetical protein
MDALTAEIITYLDELPIEKKRAVLELVKPTLHPATTPPSPMEWRERWLAMPVWNEQELRAIEEIHEELNAWEPAQW